MNYYYNAKTTISPNDVGGKVLLSKSLLTIFFKPCKSVTKKVSKQNLFHSCAVDCFCIEKNKKTLLSLDLL